MKRSLRFGIVFSFAATLCATGAIPASAQRPVTSDSARFVASSRGTVFYWIGCDGWRKLSRANLRFFRTAAAAEGAGYKPSKARGCAPQLVTAPVAARIGGRAECTIERIVDGDTFTCRGGSRVRLLLIDTPELEQKPFGEESRAFTASLMPVGSHVRLEFDVELFDRYDRVLAYAYADSVFVNREIVRRGMGVVAVYPPNVRLVDVLRAAADSARAERLGLWSESAFDCRPADFRAGRCR